VDIAPYVKTSVNTLIVLLIFYPFGAQYAKKPSGQKIARYQSKNNQIGF
jgi:hypothetical protein